jgi:oligosaccharyltransferase complex subunit beta
LLLLPTKAKSLGQALTPSLIVDFVNAGSNVLLALSATVGVPVAVNNLLSELDITLSAEKNSVVIDHFQHDVKSAAEEHDVLVVNIPDFAGKKLKNFFTGKAGAGGYIAFPRAVGQVLGNESPLLQSVIKAPSTAYIRNPKEDAEGEDPFATGAQVSLVTSFQARNSARFTVLGSAEALEDKWFDAKLEVQLPGKGQKSVTPENKLFAQQVAAWTFKEAGVLKVGQIRHYLNEGDQKGSKNASGVPSVEFNPEIYRIKNDVHYEIELSEWANGQWTPFAVPAGDALQLEFSMLSPFHRLGLVKQADTASSSIYAVDFKLPDQHGIFNFFVEYRRPFYTVVEEKNTVSVRHFAHDEWPRSYVISGAWPWIGGIWVTITGWILFVALWLYSKPATEKKNLKRS